MVIATGTSSTQAQQTTVVPPSNMGSFKAVQTNAPDSPSAVFEKELFLKKLRRTQDSFDLSKAFFGTLRHNIEEALKVEDTSKTERELAFYKQSIQGEKGKLESFIKEIESVENGDLAHTQEARDVVLKIKNLLNEFSLLEEKFSGETKKEGTPEGATLVNGVRIAPKTIDGIKQRIFVPRIVKKEESVVPDATPEPVIKSIPTREPPLFIVYGKKPPTRIEKTQPPVTTPEIKQAEKAEDPVTHTETVSQTVVVPQVPVAEVVQTQPVPEKIVEQTDAQVVPETPTAPTFDPYNRLGTERPKDLPVQKAIDIPVVSDRAEPQEKMRVPQLDPSIKAGPAVRKLYESIQSATKKTITSVRGISKPALVATFLLLPPGSANLATSVTQRTQGGNVFTETKQETKFMFNLLSPLEQKNVLLFSLDAKNFASTVASLDGESYEGLLSKTSDGKISPHKILHDENLNGLYVMSQGTQKDIRKEASDLIQAITNIGKQARVPNPTPKEDGNESVDAYIKRIQSNIVAQLKSNNVI
jgi:hypothetical protein